MSAKAFDKPHLDLGCALLDLVVSHFKAQLTHSALDCVPAGQSVGKVDVTSHAEISRVDDLVGGGVGQDGLRVYASLVCERAKPCDVVVEWYFDFHSIRHEILDRFEFGQVVLAQNVVTVGNQHPSDKSTQGRNSIAFTDAQDRGVYMRGTALKSTVCVRNGAASVVVEVGLDVASYAASERPDEVIDLPRIGTSNCVSNPDTVDTDFVYRRVDVEKID